MNSDHPTIKISRGDSIDAVRDLLQLAEPPEPIPDPERGGSFYHLEELGFWVFFDKDSLVYSIRFESPFEHEVEGIRVGSSREEVMQIHGKPQRKLPIPDSTERWIYDQPRFLRFDFNPQTNRVEKIFR